MRRASIKDIVSKYLGTDVVKYLDYLDNKPVAISQLRPPVRSPRMMSRWTATQRFVCSTAVSTDGDANAFFLVNPYYADQHAIVRTQLNNAAIYPACSWGNGLAALTELKPTTLLNDGPLPNAVYTATGTNSYSATHGNIQGDRRVIGIELTLTPLGTQLNAGGEVYFFHDPALQGIAGQSVNSLINNPMAVRRSLATNRAIKMQYGFVQTGSEFKHLQAFANSDNDPAETDHASFHVFGRGEHFLGSSTTYGPDTITGWDFGMLIESAVTEQRYEVFVKYHYEGIRGVVNDNGYVNMPTTMAHANPSGLAVIESAMHAHAYARHDHTDQVSIWPHVVDAVKHVLPHVADAAIGAMVAAG